MTKPSKMKYPIEKMRAHLDLLPPPGGEVVAGCLDEIESLRQQLANSIVINMTKAPESSVKLVNLLRVNAESLLCQQAADEIEGLHTELASALLWKEAIEHELIVVGIWRHAHENDPKSAVKEAIDWYVQIARDPQVGG